MSKAASGNAGSKRRRPLTPTSPIYSKPESPQLLPSIEKILDSHMGKINERFTKLETHLSQHVESFDKRLKEFSEALKFQNHQTEHLKKEIPRLENEMKEEQLERGKEIDRLAAYICRENVVIMGIPEKSEKEDTENIVREFYKVNLGLTDEQVENIEHQRVHRVAAASRPRPIKARYLRYSDKMLVIGNAKKLKGSSFYIADDLPKRVRDERRLQMPALRAARNEGRLAFFSRTEPWKLYIEGKYISREDQRKFLEKAERRDRLPRRASDRGGAMEVTEGTQKKGADLEGELKGAVGGE